MRPRILLIDDEAGTRFGFVRYLSNVGYDVCATNRDLGVEIQKGASINDRI